MCLGHEKNDQQRGVLCIGEIRDIGGFVVHAFAEDGLRMSFWDLTPDGVTCGLEERTGGAILGTCFSTTVGNPFGVLSSPTTRFPWNLLMI